MWKWKGLGKRYLSRLVFFLVVTITSLVYEWFLIVPAIDKIIDTPYVRLLLSLFNYFLT